MDKEFFSSYLLNNAPSTAYYIPDFITEEEEQYLLRHINDVPKPKWTCLAHRRLQDYGGIPHAKGILPEEIPSWLQTYMTRVSDLQVFFDAEGNVKQANHCLINEYLPGQGIMAHSDGPIFTATITTLSLGSHTILEFVHEHDGKRDLVCKLLLEPRSLIILKDDLYKKYLHQINEVKEDILDDNCVNLGVHKVGDVLLRNTRVSLTIRNVPKVIKCNLLKMMKK